MNFKSASLCLLSVSILAMPPDIFAAKKSTLEEVKTLQANLLKAKSSIDSLLNSKPHIIPKETEKAPLYSAIRQMSLDSVKEHVVREDLFKAQDVMAVLLKDYRMSDEDKAEPSANPAEKIYSITVLNTQNHEVLKQAHAEMIKNNQQDDFIRRMSKYVDLTMKGERYLSFKQAEDLSNKIYKMNQDLEQVEELALKLSPKEQQAVETFRKNMSEWLNKKLVFTEINKKGFTADIDVDSHVQLFESSFIKILPLNKNYTAENIAATVKKAIVPTLRERQALRRDDLKLVSDNKRTEHKISFKEAEDVNVAVSADRLKATISTRKFTITNSLVYPRNC